MGKKFYNEADIQDIADAIRTKGGSGTFTVSEMAAAIESLPSGGGVSDAPLRDVNFYDYDGTRVYSYTAADFLALNSLPANPTHDGLIAQGWNWTLTEAQDFVQANGAVDIGQNYVTDDGKTRLYMDLAEGALSPEIRLNQGSGAVVDWGDGSPTDTITGSYPASAVQHTYAAPGQYVITIDCSQVTSPPARFDHIFGTTEARPKHSKYLASVRAIELGTNIVLSNYGYAPYQGCAKMYNLETISIPASMKNVGAAYSFQYTASLRCVVMPPQVGMIEEYFLQYSGVKNLIASGKTTYAQGQILYANMRCERFVLPTRGPSGATARGMQSLKAVVLPSGTESLSAQTFADCSSLISVHLPDTITSIGNYAFQNCYSLTEINLPASLTRIPSGIFSGCNGLPAITLPAGVTSIGSEAFYYCSALQAITLPDGITSIESSAFSNCSGLTAIDIPAGVTSIGYNAFYGTALRNIRLRPTTPPTLSNTMFSLSAGATITVPHGCLETYQTATNWGYYASYMVEASE